MNRCALKVLIVLFLILFAGPSLAWHDKTHISIAKAAGMDTWYNVTGPDMTKLKAGELEILNHYCNNNRGVEVTPELVLAQVKEYNGSRGDEGHVYGAIIGALRAYSMYLSSGKYAEYHLAFAAHYIGDFTMPLHNIPYDNYNEAHHAVNDGTVENIVFNQLDRIERHMYDIKLSDDHFEVDLAREIARIANVSRLFGYQLRAESRDMTPDEAYIQLGHSASLLKAVLRHFRKI